MSSTPNKTSKNPKVPLEIIGFFIHQETLSFFPKIQKKNTTIYVT